MAPEANTTGRISRDRVTLDRMGRFNPIRQLTPEKLSRVLEEFKAGYLRQWSRMMDAIEERDDVVSCVAPKRKKAVARRNIEVLIKPGVDESQKAEAEKHQQALKYFYENLEASDATDLNQLGGVELLIRQMMDAVGKKYAVHEILWNQTTEGITARLQFVPLHFFENRTGKLRFLASEFAVEGEELEEGAWMVTTGEGIMEATSVCYMFKRLAVQDWTHYSAKHGMPGIVGKTDAEKGSDRWNEMKAAVADIAANFSSVTSLNEIIEKIDLATEGQLPYPIFVERMDRAISALWRGADLSTMSAGIGQGQGASLQEDETDLLEADDAGLIAGTLQRYLDRWVIEYTFGPGVKPLACVTLSSSSDDKAAAAFQREVWKGFLADGTVSDVLANLTDLKALTGKVGLPVNEEYSDPYLPVLTDRGLVTGQLLRDSEGDVIGAKVDAGPGGKAQVGASPAGPQGQGGKESDLANEDLGAVTDKAGDKVSDKEAEAELTANALARALGVRPRWLAALKPFLKDLIAALQDDSKADEAVLQFLAQSAKRLPELAGDMDWHVLADALEAGMGTAAVHGLKDALRHSMGPEGGAS